MTVPKVEIKKVKDILEASTEENYLRLILESYYYYNYRARLDVAEILYEKFRSLYEAFITETSLPEIADLPKTMRIYLECQFEEGGQMVPLTAEVLAKRLIMASA